MHKRICIMLSMFILLIGLSGCAKKNTSGQLSSIDDYPDVSIKGTQTIDIKSYRLRIDGLVDSPKEFTYDQALQKPAHSKVLEIVCVEGPSANLNWQGILLKDLFADVNVKNSANTVIFYGADGYTTSLPLGYIMDKDILLAYKINDQVLTPDSGYPFQVAAEGKLGYKWAKWITRIELSNDPSYKGYWEQRGYSNDADI